MYLIIPFLLILGSVVAITIIVWRKAPYLKKLTTVEGTMENGTVSLSRKDFFSKLFSDFYPELVESLKQLKLSEYKDLWLVELEKILRRLRLVSLRMDRFSDGLIWKIRSAQNSSSNEQPIVKPEVIEPIKIQPVVPISKADERRDEMEGFKREEQRLIIEIAKNPKDSKLYDVLGDLYISMGNFGDAKESFEAAMELDSNSTDLKKKHSFVLAKLNTLKSSQG